jgi:hypothetical protein
VGVREGVRRPCLVPSAGAVRKGTRGGLVRHASVLAGVLCTQLMWHGNKVLLLAEEKT